ncbi:protein kinase domain-containing protein [Prevotella sp.]|uniref:protein kinase domain-containing protein n=1 Tax=Prevotella sp. TaxID=59823 RepID=UPI0039C96BDC
MGATIHDVCKGVKVLHDSNILHQSIKPYNILIKNGTIKVSEFCFVVTAHDSTSLISSN